MSDPLGLIANHGSIGRLPPIGPGSLQGNAPSAGDGPNFKDMLQEQIDTVNKLQNDADAAMEDLAAGRRDDVESVIIATQKADIAFKMLLQVRNKVVDAYEEIKQIRI
jgi:flagellar hook-basal body complex protein FliE